MSALLLISLGPIQDFIASARRCQDLWFGSWLLSELSRTTAEAVKQLGGADCVVIFPASVAASGGQSLDRPGVANKILARLPGGTQEAARVAESAESTMRTRLREVRDLAWKKLPEATFHRATANLQVDELLEYLWVAVPDDGYGGARKKAEKQLATLKNTRLWTQPPWHPDYGIPKSSLDGERESVIDESAYASDLPAEKRRQSYGVKGMERLCGIGLLKRLGPAERSIFHGRRPDFHSTSQVAMRPAIRRITSTEEGRGAAREYLRELAALGLELERFALAGGAGLVGYDGVLLLKSRLLEHFSEGYSAKQMADPAVRARVDAQVLAGGRALQQLLESAGLGDPVPYYAFLVADGDRMGVAIDGMKEIAHHLELGRALDRFSQACRDIVSRHEGSLVFAGGDDVLALLPLHTALACCRELAETFVGEVQPVVDAHSRDPDGEIPQTSLSAGLAICHSREPMGEALATARRAEKRAKNNDRNSLALIVAKRGGGDLEVVGRWDEEPDRRLKLWMDLLDREEVPSKVAHDLERAAAHYERLDPASQRARADEIVSLAHQVLERKQRSGGGGSAAIEQLTARIQDEREPAAAVRRLSSELQVAELLLRALRNATDEPVGLREEAP